MKGTMKGKRRKGKQKKRWKDNIEEWIGMDFARSTKAAIYRKRWEKTAGKSFGALLPWKVREKLDQTGHLKQAL